MDSPPNLLEAIGEMIRLGLIKVVPFCLATCFQRPEPPEFSFFSACQQSKQLRAAEA